MEQTNDSIDVSVEDKNNTIPGDGADVYASVSDGEYATVWCVFRYSDYEIATTTYRVHNGTAHRDGEAGKTYHEVAPSTKTKEWAESYAQAHKTSVDVAREKHSA